MDERNKVSQVDFWHRKKVIAEMSNFNVSDEVGQLVFADWLEEQGQLGWAELARLWTPSKLKTLFNLYKNWVDFPTWILTQNWIERDADWHPGRTAENLKGWTKV